MSKLKFQGKRAKTSANLRSTQVCEITMKIFFGRACPRKFPGVLRLLHGSFREFTAGVSKPVLLGGFFVLDQLFLDRMWALLKCDRPIAWPLKRSVCPIWKVIGGPIQFCANRTLMGPPVVMAPHDTDYVFVQVDSGPRAASSQVQESGSAYSRGRFQ